MTTSLLVDTSSLTYRAFHALPTSITDDDGHAVNAIRGYLDMVSTVVEQVRPDQVRHCFDDSEIPPARLLAYPGYKASRKTPPPEIIWQFGLLRELLPAMGEQIVEAPGWEADDAIGTLCAQAGEGDRVVVLTGDRDLIQLVRDPVVQVWFTVSGTKQMRQFDEALVARTYGVAPQRYVDFAILRGDPSDGLPGIRGVGEKTARRFVDTYPSLAALVAAADEQTPKMTQTLAASGDYIDAMLQVVPVQSDLDLRELPSQGDPDMVAQLAQRHALSGPVERWRERRA